MNRLPESSAPPDSGPVAPAVPAHVPLVVSLRGGTVELVHAGSVAVVDASGRLLASAGDPRALNFTRSALKPVQALPFVRAGGMARLGFGSHELALMCASHNGEAVHARIVRRILAAAGADDDDLRCGCHAPMFYAATGERAPAGVRWSPLFHNCSGKHAGFIAQCRIHGEPIDRYLEPDAPVQRRIRATLGELADGDPVAAGIDGCSAPNYALPLVRLAAIYARLAASDEPDLGAVRAAMVTHPDLVSGAGRTDLALMALGQGDWVSKVGADGVQAIGVRSRRLGIVVRIADGNPRALQSATAAVLRELDLAGSLAGTALADWERPVLRNARGTVVGAIEPVLRLARH